MCRLIRKIVSTGRGMLFGSVHFGLSCAGRIFAFHWCAISPSGAYSVVEILVSQIVRRGNPIKRK